MVKRILLKIDNKFFYKMKKHKMKLEEKKQKRINWEDYIKILFGFKK